MALNLDELMIGDIILNDEGKPCVVEGLYRNQIYTNKGVYLPFEVDPMPLDDDFLVNNGFKIEFPYEDQSYKNVKWSSQPYKGHIILHYRIIETCALWQISTNTMALFVEKVYVHNLQHLIRELKLNITLTCQQSS